MARLDILLGLLALALVIWLTAIFFHRKLYRPYPLFFTYIAFSILAHVAILCASGNYQAYFKVYWTTEALQAVLALLALYEAFRDVFRIDYEDWPRFKLIFPLAVGILAAFFIGDALLHPPLHAGPLVTIVISFGKVVNFVKGCLFGLFFLLAALLAERWQRYPFGIVTGFAISAAGSAAAYWAVSVFGTKAILFAHYALPMAYILAVLVWIGTCFQRPDPEFRPPPMGILVALRDAKQYNRALRWMTGRR